MMEQKQHNDDQLADYLDLLITKMTEDPPTVKQWTAEEERELYSRAYHFYQNGKYAEAADFFRTLTTINCGDVAYWAGLAGALKMQRDYAKALETYSIAAIIHTNDPYNHAHAADCCFALGDIDRGMMALSSAETLAANEQKYQELTLKLEALRQAWTKET